MSYISRRQVEREGWTHSIGLPLDMEHFREPPPDKRHAVFEPDMQYGTVHYDRYNPHAGLGDLLNHLLDWSPLGTLALAYVGYRILKAL